MVGGKKLVAYHIEIQISVAEGALHRLNPNIPTGEMKQMQFVSVLVCVYQLAESNQTSLGFATAAIKQP